MKQAKLDRRISEPISIAVQVRQGCELCLDSHVAAAASLGIEDNEVDLAKRGTSSDPAIAPMVAYGLQVHEAPGAITTAQVEELRGLGYTDREIAEVVGLVALDVLTGAFNLVAGLSPRLVRS